MSNATTPTIAVLGAGHVGPAIARLALDAGHSVAIATSGNPGHLALVTQLLDSRSRTPMGCRRYRPG